MKKFLSLILCLFLASPLVLATPSRSTTYGDDMVLMQHFDGADGSTTFSDAYWSPTGSVRLFTNTSSTTPHIDTGTSVFGGSSLHLPSVNSILYFWSEPGYSLYNFGTEDFTIDFWYNTTAFPTTGYAMALMHSGTTTVNGYWSLRMVPGSAGTVRWRFQWRDTTTQTINSNQFTITNGSWHHCAVTRKNGMLQIYSDGVAMGAPAAVTRNFNYSAAIEIGVNGNSLIGYYDELRIVRGRAIYNGNFTPATSAYTNGRVLEAQDYTIRENKQCDTLKASTVSTSDVNTMLTYAKPTKGLYFENSGSNEVYLDFHDGVATTGQDRETLLAAGANRSFQGLHTSQIGLINSSGETSTVTVEACY